MKRLKVSFTPHEDAWIQFMRAYVLQVQGDLFDAIKAYRRSIKLHPTAEAYAYLGATYCQQGRYDLGLKFCQRAVGLDPDFARGYLELGRCHLLDHRPAAAIQSFRQALAALRGDDVVKAEIYLSLGQAYEASYQLGMAIMSYRRALQDQPACEPAALRLVYLLNQNN